MSDARYIPMLSLGRGAMGEVWLGIVEGADEYRRPVVLKRASATGSFSEDAARKALRREAHVYSVLHHPNIVHVYELIDTTDGLVLAMEYLAGVSVRTLLASDDAILPWPMAARVVADAARGLDHAHHARDVGGVPLHIVHRDLSPDNLMITEDGITKVLDFGIAQSVRNDTSTGASMLKGTLPYVSPEQLRGDALDWRTDVYSLGMILRELVTGDNPFARVKVADLPRALMETSVLDLPASVPGPIRDVLRQMLTKDPVHRALGMGDVADMLESIAVSKGGGHRQCAAYIREHYGPLLEERRERLQAALEGHIAPTSLPGESGTTVSLLESALDSIHVDVQDEFEALPDTLIDFAVSVDD